MDNKIIDVIRQAHQEFQVLKGGAGSGNFGHSGRPGKLGGSAGGGGSMGGGMNLPEPNAKVGKVLAQLDVNSYQQYNKSNLPADWNVGSRGDISNYNGKHGRSAWIVDRSGVYNVGVATADGAGEKKLSHQTTNFAEALAYGDAWVKGKAKF